MPPLDLDARVQTLVDLQAHGMGATDARATDAAAAQYAQGDLDEYNLFLAECFGVWSKNRALRPADVVVRAVQPPQIEAPVLLHIDATARARQEAGASEREARRMAMRTAASICPKCKSQVFMTLEYEKQTRAADEGGTPFRKCDNPKCNHKWRARKNEVNEVHERKKRARKTRHQ